MFAIRHSQEMTNAELTHTIGDDPVAVVRRAGLMTRAIAPIVAIISGLLVALFERRMPGRMTILVLLPYFVWDFSMSASSSDPSISGVALDAVRIAGFSAIYITFAALISLVFARLVWSGVRHLGTSTA
jgi:ABC-type glucose/galactose transport system permease subunit